MQIRKINWHDKQKEIVRSLKTYNKFFIHGGIRSGKSWVVLYLIDLICRMTPGMTALVVRKSFESIKKDTHIVLSKNPGFLTPDKGQWKDGGKRFEYHNGSVIYFTHAEGAEHLLGMTCGLIFFEQVELIKQEDFQLIKDRLSQWGGESFGTKNYLEQYGAYIKAKKLLPPKNYLFLTANPKACWVKEDFIDKQNEEFKTFHLTTYDNLHNLDSAYLSHNASADYKKRYYEGSWEFNSGLIYPEFDDGNIVEPNFEIENQIDFSKLKTYISIDPGYAYSKFAITLSCVLPDGKLYIFDEVVRNGKKVEEWEKVGVDEIVKELKAKYAKYKFEPNQGLIDYAANTKVGGSESITHQFTRQGIPVRNANKSKEIETIFGMKNMLKAKKLLVNSRCVQVIREFGLYRWEDVRGKPVDKPHDEDNDCLDTIRYVVNDFPNPAYSKGTYQDQFNKTWGPDYIYQNWLKTWYGVEPKKTNLLTIKNDTPLDWGI